MNASKTYVHLCQEISKDERISIWSASGNSMSPLIVDGTLIVVYKTKDFRVGDVIVFKSGSRYVTHRLIRKNMFSKKLLLTKGDNLLNADTPLSHAQVFGKVVAVMQCNDSGGHKNLFNVVEEYENFHSSLNRFLVFFSLIQWSIYNWIKGKTKILGCMPGDFRDFSLMIFHLVSNPVLVLMKIYNRIILRNP